MDNKELRLNYCYFESSFLQRGSGLLLYTLHGNTHSLGLITPILGRHNHLRAFSASRLTDVVRLASEGGGGWLG